MGLNYYIVKEDIRRYLKRSKDLLNKVGVYKAVLDCA